MKEIERQEKIQKEIKKILNRANYTYQGFYKFKLQIVNAYIDRYCIVDELGEFDDGSQDFDNCLEFFEQELRRIFKDNSIHLEKESKGRWDIYL